MSKGTEAGPIAERVRELRKALGMTQEGLGERGGKDRVVITHIENGHNKASSMALRVALAKGFDLSIEDMNAYLDGEISVRQALRRVRSGPRTGTDG